MGEGVVSGGLQGGDVVGGEGRGGEGVPSVRLGSSVETPPEGETFKGPSLPTEWEASFSEAAWSLRAAASA